MYDLTGVTETPATGPSAEAEFLLTSYAKLRQAVAANDNSNGNNNDDDGSRGTNGILPSPEALHRCLASLPRPASPSYLRPLGPHRTHAHLLETVLPALNRQSLSPRYLGFVTGGALPVAEAADNLVSALDQNVMVHFPPPPPPPPLSTSTTASSSSSSSPPTGTAWAHSASTAVEDAALRMVVSLLNLDGGDSHGHGHRRGHGHGDASGSGENTDCPWKGRTFTTGATASNILGLACGREAVVSAWLARARATRTETETETETENPVGGDDSRDTVAELGLLRACHAAGIRSVQILTSMAHSSLSKAASVVGLGRASVRELGRAGDTDAGEEGEQPWRLDLDAVERALARGEADGVASIVVVSAGEVNTGRFATNVLDMPKLRSLADRYGAWIHVDGAFGIFARALPRTDEFLALHANVAGLELADSIAADGHKLLNVPYDNGIFLCRDAAVLTQVFSNTNAAYLASQHDPDAILSPLNVGIENSRRFRALPVYAVLLSEGREGIAAMLGRMVLLARRIAAYVRDSEHYEWLPSGDAPLESTYMVVLFRARDAALNEVLVDRINATGRMFVSGTAWGGRKAVRIAVASWRVDVERDAAIIREVLTAVAEGR